ncbi:peptidase M22, glycoprotease [Novosphingobium nitrogenifigens DSM 19370]|uniref:Peptidase M22, glycoprotease n=1 Tax=Novosphingobium nitrogenifigens DSM 19370 TaxID=983920 RepID=F1Z755_9SPHN|nr:tRNA (adenosine(37)-N6)-threonylcarbamoyltransferase complex dimerization subunit type 1 TsaB [Novosphingobium nitrogenifigens]EGD59561.1 peptidase M22, glycoprotease [Novosphingobium nitrogenifigens DSM 19370]
MRVLVIDSATEACSVALFENGQVVAGECRQLGRGHAEHLVPMIAALPGSGRAERIAVNVGPGSFTGIRVGLAAARALGLAWNASVVGYGCLDLVAAMAREQHPDTAIDIVMSGGHGEWFFQPFGPDGRALAPTVSLVPDAVIAATRAPLVAGSQAEAVATRNGAHALPLWPDARAFGALDEHAMIDDPAPIYGRAPDARLPQPRQQASRPEQGPTLSA